MNCRNIVLVLCLFAIACASGLRVETYTDEVFPPQSQIDVYDKPPKREGYVEIGKLSTRATQLTQDTVDELAKKAGKLGADAIIIMTKGAGQAGKIAATDQASGGIYHPPTIQISATMIRYPD